MDEGDRRHRPRADRGYAPGGGGHASSARAERRRRDEAAARTLEFIDRANAVKSARRRGAQQLTREEGSRAAALETGTTVLVAIYYATPIRRAR